MRCCGDRCGSRSWWRWNEAEKQGGASRRYAALAISKTEISQSDHEIGAWVITGGIGSQNPFQHRTAQRLRQVAAQGPALDGLRAEGLKAQKTQVKTLINTACFRNSARRWMQVRSHVRLGAGLNLQALIHRTLEFITCSRNIHRESQSLPLRSC
jgi:hypothetical protein